MTSRSYSIRQHGAVHVSVESFFKTAIIGIVLGGKGGWAAVSFYLCSHRNNYKHTFTTRVRFQESVFCPTRLSVKSGLFASFMTYSTGLKELFTLRILRSWKQVPDPKCFRLAIHNHFAVVIFVVDSYWHFSW